MKFSPISNTSGQVRGNVQGFTLIEVIVALSVFAVGLASVAAYTNQALNENALSHAVQEASQFADRHLSEIQIDAVLEAGTYAGSYPRPDGSLAYDWRLIVEPLELAPLQEELVAFTNKVIPLKATLRVFLREFERNLDFHVLVLAPPMKANLSDESKKGLVR